MTEASYQCKVDLYLKRLQNSLGSSKRGPEQDGAGSGQRVPADRVSTKGYVAAFRWFLVGVTKALSTYLPLPACVIQ